MCKMVQLSVMQVNVAIMLAPVAFLGHITSQPVEAMVRMETDRVSCSYFLFETHLGLAILSLTRTSWQIHAVYCASWYV